MKRRAASSSVLWNMGMFFDEDGVVQAREFDVIILTARSFAKLLIGTTPCRAPSLRRAARAPR